MNSDILFIILSIIFFVLAAIAMVVCIYIFINMSCKPAKTKKQSIELNVGDVLLMNFISKNPFENVENKYETVTEVRRNDDGDIYFLSYTSDENGVKSLEQNRYCAEHSYGKHYWPENWKVVNHIEIK